MRIGTSQHDMCDIHLFNCHIFENVVDIVLKYDRETEYENSFPACIESVLDDLCSNLGGG